MHFAVPDEAVPATSTRPDPLELEPAAPGAGEPDDSREPGGPLPRRVEELREQNRQLRQLNRLKDEFLSICAHDLRSPLNVVLGHVRLLGDVQPSDPQAAHRVRRAIDSIDRQARRMLELVQDLLEMRRAGAEGLELHLGVFDVGGLVEECLDALGLSAQQNQVKLLCQLPPGPLRLLADSSKVREVVMNLVGNAVKFTPPEGTVAVTVEARDDAVVVQVKDTGPGIQPDLLPVLFERFRTRLPQGAPASTPQGTGLGLAICRELIELHGGEIWAESSPGAGATFVFMLPRTRLPGDPPAATAAGPVATTAAGEAPNESVVRGTRRQLLLVEDDTESIELLTEILGQRYEMVSCRNGKQAIEWLQLHTPDLVLLDLFMPQVDGLTVLERLRRRPRTPELPVVVVSGCSDAHLRVKGLSLGAADVVRKPFHPAELLARIDKVLAQADQRDRLRAQAHLDELTGLSNLRCFRERLHEELSRSARYRSGLALVLIDLDHLKQMNDTLGHDTGNRALGHLATTLRQAARETDVVARVGGDEFAALLPETAGPAAQRFAERVRRQLAASMQHQQDLPPITVSMGIAVHDGVSSPSETTEALLKRADVALYAAKAAGRNTVRLANEP
jgi:diguanylate cyclase (GGDEF)-like protein